MNIGRISAAVGLKGEVRITLLAQDSVNLKEGKDLLLKRGKEEIETAVTGVRHQNGKPVCRLDGINDRTAAEEIRGFEIYVSEDKLEKLPEGQFYVRDMLGVEVFDRASGSVIGRLTDVIEGTAQKLYQVTDDEGREILIPAVPAFIRSMSKERIEVELIPGFL